MMSQMETNLFDDCTTYDLDLLDNTYYKLPFCDEDVLDLKNPCDSLWNQQCSNDDVFGDIPYSSSSRLSPASSSSASSGGHTDHLLLNERPDTPLMAVKFEDFSSTYNLDELAFPTIDVTQDDDGIEEINIDDQITLDIKQNNDLTTSQGGCASERTVDCSLSPPFTNQHQLPVPKIENVFSVSKTCTSNTAVKPTFLPCDIKSEGIRFSFSKDQPTIPCLSIGSVQTQRTSSSNSSSQLYLNDQITSAKATTPQATVVTTVSTNTTTCSESSHVNPAPVHRFKVVPQSKLTTNSFTHKTHIQIPTSTLQTILKNGRLVTRLQQQDGKIRIKTEPCADVKQFVKICQPQQVELPPTPPSSASSDGEGSSSPKSTGSRTAESPCFPHSQIRVQPGSNLAAQLLSSSQRFTQTHGTLLLTEEEKRTLIAEGYPVPTKLPLTKNEEKSLKKIRRKIKNKLSAQESRRKKKEYVETLEKRMDDFNKENMDLKMKLDSLESSNRSLLSQLRSLQTLVAGKMPKPSRSVTTQTSSCLMMLVLCFAVFLGGWYPHLSPWGDSQTNSLAYFQSLESRPTGKVLFSFKEEHCFNLGCDDKPDMLEPDKRETESSSGSDTYDEPTGGRTTMNDTGDQTGKIVANTMEPRTAAEILASRKVVMKSSKMEVVVDKNTLNEVYKKKVVISSTPIVTQ